jgi:hypothetical protein
MAATTNPPFPDSEKAAGGFCAEQVWGGLRNQISRSTAISELGRAVLFGPPDREWPDPDDGIDPARIL